MMEMCWRNGEFGIQAVKNMYPGLVAESHLFEYLNRLPSVLIDDNDSLASK